MKSMSYPLNHHLLDWFFHILDLLPLVAINQHDLRQEFIHRNISFTLMHFLSPFWQFCKQDVGHVSEVQSPIANDHKLLSGKMRSQRTHMKSALLHVLLCGPLQIVPTSKYLSISN